MMRSLLPIRIRKVAFLIIMTACFPAFRIRFAESGSNPNQDSSFNGKNSANSIEILWIKNILMGLSKRIFEPSREFYKPCMVSSFFPFLVGTILTWIRIHWCIGIRVKSGSKMSENGEKLTGMGWVLCWALERTGRETGRPARLAVSGEILQVEQNIL